MFNSWSYRIALAVCSPEPCQTEHSFQPCVRALGSNALTLFEEYQSNSPTKVTVPLDTMCLATVSSVLYLIKFSHSSHSFGIRALRYTMETPPDCSPGDKVYLLVQCTLSSKSCGLGVLIWFPLVNHVFLLSINKFSSWFYIYPIIFIGFWKIINS